MAKIYLPNTRPRIWEIYVSEWSACYHAGMAQERPRFPVGVNVYVVRDGKLLLGRRKSTYHDGEWGLPGGHLERGEQMLACAARELMEETGIAAAGFEFINADNDARHDGAHYVHFGFAAVDSEGEPRLCEPDHCYGWEWFQLGALPSPLFIGHEKLIRAFVERVRFTE